MGLKFAFLPREIENLIVSKLNICGIYEIRIRQDKPIFINYFGEYVVLKDGFQNTVIADKKLIEYCMASLTEMSVYRYNNQIRQGFITTPEGVRVGLAGEVVREENGEIRTIKGVKSLVIRIPHEVKGCASAVFPYVEEGGEVKNTLIVSPPACGKTTLLRDLARMLSFGDKVNNLLVVDERYEIAYSGQDVGDTTDVLSGGSKTFCFGSGVRALNPSVILTDEIGSKEDVKILIQTALSGVKVIATVHAKDHQELKKKPSLEPLFASNIFERFVILSSRKGVGTIEAIMDSKFCVLYEEL